MDAQPAPDADSDILVHECLETPVAIEDDFIQNDIGYGSNRSTAIGNLHASLQPHQTPVQQRLIEQVKYSFI